MVIWGRMSSINVRKVVWCARELGLAFERIDAGRAFGVVDTEAYRALNPNGLVPTLEDTLDGERLVLWESNAIVRYLCARHAPGTWHPDRLAERFDAERWMDWQQTTLNRAGGGAFLQLVRTPPERRDAAVVAASVGQTEPLLDRLDAHLGATGGWMAAGRPTMADIPVGCELHRWFGLPGADVPRRPRPHLDRYFAALQARPAARGVLDLPLE
jgi:glutathione S-transferase